MANNFILISMEKNKWEKLFLEPRKLKKWIGTAALFNYV